MRVSMKVCQAVVFLFAAAWPAYCVHAQGVSVGWSMTGGSAKPPSAKPVAAKSSAAEPNAEQQAAWQRRVDKTKLANAVWAIFSATSESGKSCTNLDGGAVNDRLKELFADAADLDALHKECAANAYGANRLCNFIQNEAAFKAAFQHVFVCQIDDDLRRRKSDAQTLAKSMTVEIGALPHLQTPEAWSAWVGKHTAKMDAWAKQIGVDLSEITALRSEVESLEHEPFTHLQPLEMKPTEKNAAAEKAASDAVVKTTASFRCDGCVVVRSAIVGASYKYDRNAFGVVTWRGKDTQTLIRTAEKRVCGVVDGRSGQVAIGTKFVPAYNAVVPVRYLHLVACN